jgi:hypothetical protein
VHEERWQPLVAKALVESLHLDPSFLHAEVPFRDGSRIDLLYVHARRVIGFELKIAEEGAASAPLDQRALRQLRHYRGACDAVYLVTVGAPRSFSLVHDGAAIALGEVEAQPVPDGTGWIMFDTLGQTATVIRPAPEVSPVKADRAFLMTALQTRLGRALDAAKAAAVLT